MGFDPEVIASLGLTEAQAQMIANAYKPKPKQKGICACGHPSGAHTENVVWGKSPLHDQARSRGTQICAPGRSICPCPEYHQVLITADTRLFHYSTTGPEERHALSKGVKAARDRRLMVDWEPDIKCSMRTCQNYSNMPGVILVSVALDKFFYESEKPTDLNVLVCEGCRMHTMAILAPDPEMSRNVKNEDMKWCVKSK